MALVKTGLLTVVLIAFLAMSIGIVSAELIPSVLERNTYGSTSYDRFYEIIPNGEGGYLCAGSISNSFGDPAALFNVWLINFDDQNSIIWNRTFDFEYLDSANAVIQDTDGGFIVGGWSSNSLIFLKVNANGDEIWRYRRTAGAFSVINDIKKSGSYYYAGGAYYDTPTVFRFDNNNGNIIWWNSVYSGRGEILNLIPASDDTCIFVGYVGYADDLVIGKVNSSGTIIWQKILNKQDKDYGYAIDKLLEGTYIVAAYADREDIINAATWILNIDEEGTVLWESIIEGPQYNGPLDVTATSDGGFIIAGFKDFTSPYTGDLRAATGDAWLIKFDSDFNKQWDLTVGGSVTDDAQSIIEIGDDLYLFTGSTKSYGLGCTDAWVVKIGPDQKPPVADIVFLPVNPVVGESINFDGGGSSDPDGILMTYEWNYGDDSPQGSGITCSHTYVAAGSYTVTLTVTDDDGLTDSESADITVGPPLKPIAEAGPDQAVTLLGSTIYLDGTQSYDILGIPFEYFWTFITKPDGSSATISDNTSPTPTFIADKQGEYNLSLVVSNEYGASSDPDNVVISFNNIKPIADAGLNQVIHVGSIVSLDGSDSSDANGDSLTYSWTIVSKPLGSVASLDQPLSAQTAFKVDRAGEYIINLVVNDGFTDSDTSSITISAIATSDGAIENAIESINAINELDSIEFKNAKMQNALTNKITAVIQMIEGGEYQEALDKLQNDILPKTDGCALNEEPDNNDWIKDCAAQQEVYPIIMNLIEYLTELTV